MLNSVNLQGRIVRDPDMRYTTGGDAVTNITLAVERNFKNSQGKRDADFIKCTAWKKTAELIAQHFHKGDMIIIEGELRQNKWKDDNGNNRSDLEVNVNNIQFVPNGQAKSGNNSNNNNGNDVDTDNFDVPF